MNRIFIATSSFSENSEKPLRLLKKHNLTIKVNPLNRKLTPEELIYYGGDALGIIAGTESYSKSMIEQLKELIIISRLGKGMDNIDITSAREKGVKVLQTKTTPAPAVSELVLGLILNIARKICQSDKALKKGKWKKQMGSLVQGKTLGIIGLGSIGKSLVKLVKGFNFHILAYDICQDETFAAENGVVYCDLDKLFLESDIVSIHMNLTNESKGLISRKLLKKMKADSIIINTSRGEIVDENALYSALKNGKLAGAGLDVFEQEPYSGPLTELENVVLTPHIGSYAKEIRVQMEIEAANNIIKGLSLEEK